LTLYTTESGNLIYDTVINVLDVPKHELYKRAKNWVISTVRTSDKTVIFDDIENNEIRTDVTLALTRYAGSSINIKISIYLKENKVRLVNESFMYHYLGPTGVYDASFEKAKLMMKNKIYKEFDKEFDKEFTAFRDSFVNFLMKNSKSDW
jgi:hypothetical protein